MRIKKPMAFVMSLLIATSCYESEIENDGGFSNSDSPIISQAKSYFETEYHKYSPNISNYDEGTFLPIGEFTPLWDEAELLSTSVSEFIYVPIVPEYKYRAVRSDFKNGKSTAYIVNIDQRLVIEKDITNKKFAHYMQLLIPSKSHAEFLDNNATNIVAKDGFSGVAIYSIYGALARVDDYIDGTIIKSAFNTENTTNENQQLINSIIGGISIQYSNLNIQSRSGGEDDYSVWEETNKFEDSQSGNIPSYSPPPSSPSLFLFNKSESISLEQE